MFSLEGRQERVKSREASGPEGGKREGTRKEGNEGGEKVRALDQCQSATPPRAMITRAPSMCCMNSIPQPWGSVTYIQTQISLLSNWSELSYHRARAQPDARAGLTPAERVYKFQALPVPGKASTPKHFQPPK